MLNLYFIISNSLFFVAFIALMPSISNAVYFFVALIPTGPAIAALCHALSKLIREKELAPFSDFVRAYKKNFIDVLKVWLPILIAFFILVIDIQYFNQNPTFLNQVLNGVFLIALLLLAIFAFYSLIITTHFTFRIRDIYRLSIYFIFMRLKISTGNIGILFLTIVFMSLTTDFIILLASSLIAWFLMMNTQRILKDISEKFIEKSNPSNPGLN